MCVCVCVWLCMCRFVFYAELLTSLYLSHIVTQQQFGFVQVQYFCQCNEHVQHTCRETAGLNGFHGQSCWQQHYFDNLFMPADVIDAIHVESVTVHLQYKETTMDI